MDICELEISDSNLKEKITNHLKPLVIDEEKLKKLRSVFESELELGMEKGLDGSSIQMENTYIPELLDGTEEGVYLSLDLGGTNFRVIQLKLSKGRIQEEIIEYYSVAESLRLGPGTELFDFLAECIKDFCVKKSVNLTEEISLGFTFSFPMVQHALDIGVLVNWTKSFNCPGVIGEDAVKLLNTSLQKIGMQNVKVVAILNDTTGTLVAGAHDYPDTAIGLILGTGTNGAYLENIDKIIRWESGSKEGVHEVIIDPEWGAFGDNGCIDFIKSDWDRELDRNSLLPASFTYEKYFAGKYLGELTRLVLLSVYTAGLLGECPAKLKDSDAITTKNVSEIVEDTGNGSGAKQFLQDLGAKGTQEEVTVLQYIVELLSDRASVLVAVPLATFLQRMDRASTTIAVTGSLYKYHPTLKSKLETKIGRMTAKPFKFGLSDDGSGKGAGLVAAIAQRLNKRTLQ